MVFPNFTGYKEAKHCDHPQDSSTHTGNPMTFMSKDMVINTFIVAYNELKEFMASKLFKLKGEMISCDHTFKLPHMLESTAVVNGFLNMTHYS